MKMNRFTTILWDLDQTILDFEKSQDYALRYSFDKLGLEIDDEKVALYSAINDSYWKRLERGEISKEEVLLGRFITLFEKLNITKVLPQEIQPIYQDALGNVFFFQDEADKLIESLKKKGYHQYVVTNGINKTQSKKMNLSGLDKLMDGVFISELMGYPKPKKEYFDACFAQMEGISRAECILVGDSLTSDMQGGINANVATCWYNPKKQENYLNLPVDYEIRNLQELPKLLEQTERK
ncbi:MAG: YjjG family noncanonical pyrimidine nucleotidase [Lachnospiraceae bacterium]|nr:YjjG family noncanonical pyrimidine nucleotidase [Lachnospiraceae bacterium]